MDSHGFPHNNKLNETSVLESWNEHFRKIGRSWKLLAFQTVPWLLWQRWVPHQPWASQYISCFLHANPQHWFGFAVFCPSATLEWKHPKLSLLPFFTQRGERILFESSPVKCRSKKQQPLQGQGPLSANLRSPDETFMVCSGLNMKQLKRIDERNTFKKYMWMF